MLSNSLAGNGPATPAGWVYLGSRDSQLPIPADELKVPDDIMPVSLASQSSRALTKSIATSGLRVSRTRSKRRGRGNNPQRLATMGRELLTSAFSATSRPREVRKTKVLLKLGVDVFSSAGGVFDVVTSNDPSVATGWSAWAGAYEMYRVLRHKVVFQPRQKYDTAAALSQAPIAYAVDYNSSTALTSYATALEYETFLFANTADSWEVEAVAPNAPPYNEWQKTSTPVPTLWLKPYANGIGVTQNFGVLLAVYEVEFMAQA